MRGYRNEGRLCQRVYCRVYTKPNFRGKREVLRQGKHSFSEKFKGPGITNHKVVGENKIRAFTCSNHAFVKMNRNDFDSKSQDAFSFVGPARTRKMTGEWDITKKPNGISTIEIKCCPWRNCKFVTLFERARF